MRAPIGWNVPRPVGGRGAGLRSQIIDQTEECDVNGTRNTLGCVFFPNNSIADGNFLRAKFACSHRYLTSSIRVSSALRPKFRIKTQQQKEKKQRPDVLVTY